MPIAISPGERFDYVLEREQNLPEDQRTTFHLAVVLGTQRQHFDAATHRLAGYRAHIQRGVNVSADDAAELEKEMLKTATTAVQACLKGWSNFKDKSGAAVPFAVSPKPEFIWGEKVQPPAPDTLAALRSFDIIELFTAIADHNQITEGEAKN